MTLEELFHGNLSAEALSNLWLVFDYEFSKQLSENQPKYQNQAVPIELIDKNFTLCADLLTEKNGMYAPTFKGLDQALFSSVSVVTFDQICNLFPNPQLP